jgi:nitrite reductase/ring-hydroxylating ferredoxin subunit
VVIRFAQENTLMPRFVPVATKSQIPEKRVIGVQVEGKSLAVVNLHGEIYALDGCPREQAPLSDGQIVGEEVEWRSLALLRQSNGGDR